jgi:hypothetical protein
LVVLKSSVSRVFSLGNGSLEAEAGSLSSSANQMTTRASHQFSVRGLLVMTFVASIVLTIMRVSRGSPIFGSLASAWTWTSFLMIGAAWMAARGVESKPKLIAASVLAYVVSLAVPALAMGDDLEWGWMAWLQSCAFGFGFVIELFDPPDTTGQWFQIQIDDRLPFACLLGMFANSLIILGWISYCWSRMRRVRPRVTRWFAWSAFFLMIACVVPIALAAELEVLFPGFALWVMSALFLAYGAADVDTDAPLTGVAALSPRPLAGG